MTDELGPWTAAPDSTASPAVRNGGRFAPVVPLGGVAPVPAAAAQQSDVRDLVLAALLLVAALLAGGASLMGWRDFGGAFGIDPGGNGWVQSDGTIGRGWAAVVLAVALAVGGILVAVHRDRIGRRVAVAAASGMMLLAVLEFGFGTRRLPVGPGAGLWVELIAGAVALVAVGVLLPNRD
ncbi:MAG: hypothetical protein ACKOYM_09775 [Actinomycetes bacterium]